MESLSRFYIKQYGLDTLVIKKTQQTNEPVEINVRAACGVLARALLRGDYPYWGELSVALFHLQKSTKIT